MYWNNNKYKSKKTVVDGITFDSKKESIRYIQLKAMEDRGEISNLQMQVKYELLPSQRVNGRVIERPCKYIADFVYWHNGKTVVEDTKGMKTKDYIIKRKLMLWVHGIQIEEI